MSKNVIIKKNYIIVKIHLGMFGKSKLLFMNVEFWSLLKKNDIRIANKEFKFKIICSIPLL